MSRRGMLGLSKPGNAPLTVRCWDQSSSWVLQNHWCREQTGLWFEGNFAKPTNPLKPSPATLPTRKKCKDPAPIFAHMVKSSKGKTNCVGFNLLDRKALCFPRPSFRFLPLVLKPLQLVFSKNKHKRINPRDIPRPWQPRWCYALVRAGLGLLKSSLLSTRII